jgi:hypothetical protein
MHTININCEKCGTLLEYNCSGTYKHFNVIIPPCESCQKFAEAQGYQIGYAEGKEEERQQHIESVSCCSPVLNHP